MKNLALKKLAVLSLLGGSMVSGAALAATCDSASTSGGSEQSLQGIFDDITVSGPSSVTANTDCLADSGDSTWGVTAAGGSFATMIIEIAGQSGSNTFGVYDSANKDNFVQLFSGTATGGSQATLSIKLDGSVFVNLVDTGIDFAGNSFGYYMGGGNTFYSDTSLNGDEFDHMLAYQGTNDMVQLPTLEAGPWTPNEYILAWEDIYEGGDKDYNDMVLMVESVNPVPIPAAAWLFGSGLIGLAGIARRKKATA